MKNLISMTDFVLEQCTEINTGEIFYRRTYSYATFLKQPLELWMFVPCDEYGNILNFPNYSDWMGIDDEHSTMVIEYYIAKERCLFEWFHVENKSEFTVWLENENYSICFTNRGKVNMNGDDVFTIEDLVKHNLTLTPTAIKQIGCDH